jgi:hypothetical protein
LGLDLALSVVEQVERKVNIFKINLAGSPSIKKNILLQHDRQVPARNVGNFLQNSPQSTESSIKIIQNDIIFPRNKFSK